MHGKRPEHPAVFSARMQFHKDAKKGRDEKSETPKDSGPKAKDTKDADDQPTEKRRYQFQRKAKDQVKADEAKPKRGVLTHLLPNQ